MMCLRSRGTSGGTEETPAHADIGEAHEADPHRFDTGRPIALATDVATELGEHANDFCERGWSCNFSSTDNYVCAFGESNYGCNHSVPAERPAYEFALLVALLPLCGRRRR